MTKLSPLAITSIAFGSLIGAIIIYELANSKSTTPAKLQRTFNTNAITEAKDIFSTINPVSRSEIIGSIQDAQFLKTNGGSRRQCKKGGKRKTKGQNKR